MKFRNVLMVLAVVLAIQGCLSPSMRSPQFFFDAEDVTVPADSMSSYGTGGGTVSVSVPVRCTQSWSASLVNADAAEWLEIANPYCVNPAGADMTTAMKLVCENNDSYSSRSAIIRFVLAGGDSQEIRVTQSPKVNRIVIDGETSCMFKAEDDVAVKVKLLCNADWKAEVDSAATSCGVKSISPSHGVGDGIVTIKPEANYSCEGSVVAVVRFCVDGGDTVRVNITRQADVPFMGANAVDVTRNMLPSDTRGTLRFNCNMPWKAEVLENNIKDFKLEALEGKGGMATELPFTMTANDGQETLSAKVRLSLVSDPQKYVILNAVQRAGFMLEIDFSKVTDADSCPLQPYDASSPQLPFTSSTGLNSQGEEYYYKFMYSGVEYVFGIQNSLINVFSTNGKDGYIRLSQGYVKFPAVEGYKLAYVEFTTAATTKTYSIASDAAGTMVVGNSKTLGKEVTASWTLDSTEYNTSYYEIISTSNSRQHNLILLYVK